MDAGGFVWVFVLWDWAFEDVKQDVQLDLRGESLLFLDLFYSLYYRPRSWLRRSQVVNRCCRQIAAFSQLGWLKKRSMT